MVCSAARNGRCVWPLSRIVRSHEVRLPVLRAIAGKSGGGVGEVAMGGSRGASKTAMSELRWPDRSTDLRRGDLRFLGICHCRSHCVLVAGREAAHGNSVGDSRCRGGDHSTGGMAGQAPSQCSTIQTRECDLTRRWSGLSAIVAAPRSQWIACSPARKAVGAGPLNSVVRLL